MKKILLILGMIVLTFSMNAQNDVFTIPANEGDELRGQYVVMDEQGTSQENYNKVINYIKRVYNTPSEVIKSKINGEYIRIQGVSNLFRNLPSTHTIEFEFKQDKIRIKLLNITSRGSEGMFNVIDYCTYNVSHKSDGKPKKKFVKYTIEVVDGMNGLLNTIKKAIAEENSTDTDDDW